MNTNEETRFSWVFEHKNHGPDHRFDMDLLGGSAAAVVPTKGSIVPGWLLIIPRLKALSILELDVESRKAVLGLLKNASKMVSDFGKQNFIFEHGPSQHKSLVGCGVDQAHIHTVQLDFDLMSKVLNENNSMVWKQVSAKDPWSNLDIDKDYYLISNGYSAYVSYPIEQYSQYFRRVIAKCVGKANEWDYKSYPNSENANITVEHILGKTKYKHAA